MQFEIPCECGRRLTVTAGDAGATLRCGCGRTVQVPGLHQLRASAPTRSEEATPRPLSPSTVQLTGVDIAVCLLIPMIGFIAGVLRLLRGNPTGWRMMAVSCALPLVIFLFQAAIHLGILAH
jgi:hypothetical protein